MPKPHHPIIEITVYRLREFCREPGALFWVFGFPVIMTAVLGIAFAESPPTAPKVAVIEGPHAAWLEKTLAPSLVDAAFMGRAAAENALRKGAIDAALISPAEGRVTYLFDETRAEARTARIIVDDILQRAAGREDSVQTTNESPSVKGSRYIDFLIPGILGLNIMSSSLWGVGYALVLARRRRVLRRLSVTPMRRSHFLLGYLLFRLIFLVWEIAALLIFARAAFNVTVQGSLLSVALLSVLGAMVFVGLSLLVASRTQSLETANGWMNFLMMPGWLLSGTFFSYLRFPEAFQPLIKILPLTALNDAMRSVCNEAASVTEILPQILILGIWAAVSFAVALRVFRWQ